MSKSKDIRKEKKATPSAGASKTGKPQTSPIGAVRAAGKKASPRSKM